MRVAHVTDCYLPRLGGIEMQVRDLVERQRAAGLEAEVLTATPADPSQADPSWVRRVVALGVTGSRSASAAMLVPRAIAAGRYDVVHAHVSILSLFAARAAAVASRAGVPTVVTVHSLWNGLGPLPRMADILMRLHAQPVVWSAVSDTAAAPLRQFLGPRRPVTVLPNAIDPEFWRTHPVGLRDPRKVTVASVMRLAPRKRPRHLLQMLNRARAAVDDNVDISATLVGEGPERAGLERYLHRHDMASWVSLPGRLDRAEVRDVFAQADIYIAPALLESFGIAALEARATGLPVLASAHGGIREFVRHGREGLLTTSDTEMTRALTRLAADPQLRGRIARHNRRVPVEHTWERALSVADLLYRAAADRPPVRPGLSTRWLGGTLSALRLRD